MNCLSYAIVTIPDVEAGCRQFDLGDLDAKNAAKAMFHLHQQETGQAELPNHLQKIAALVMVKREGDYILDIQTHVAKDDTETEVISTFIKQAQTMATLISWDAAKFTVPVMRYRMLKHKMSFPRFFSKPLDPGIIDLKSLMTLAEDQASFFEMANLLSMPTPDKLSDRALWKLWLNEDYDAVGEYCLQKAKMTSQLYLRYFLGNGTLTQAQHDHEVERLFS